VATDHDPVGDRLCAGSPGYLFRLHASTLVAAARRGIPCSASSPG
jgi:hypothetical protein